jgi:chromate transporter
MLTDHKYLTDQGFAEIYALSNCLPGPTASQILLNGVAVSTGPAAGISAFACFMMPAAVVLALLGCWVGSSGNSDNSILTAPWVVHMQSGVSCAAITVIALGAQQLFKKLVGDRTTQLVFSATTVVCLVGSEQWWVTPCCLVGGGVATYAVAARAAAAAAPNDGSASGGSGDDVGGGSNERSSILPLSGAKSPKSASSSSSLSSVSSSSSSSSSSSMISTQTGVLLFTLPWVLLCATFAVQIFGLGGDAVKTVAIFFRAGSLVFGGGPVVVPMLLTQLVPAGLLTEAQFLLGFGAVNLMPGPM